MATELEEIRIDTADLAVGMYVSRLDRPWAGTAFPLQGVEVRTDEDIRSLRALCRFVYIDRHREIAGTDRLLLTLPRGRRSVRDADATGGAGGSVAQRELPHARAALQATSGLLERIYADIASGRELSVKYVEQMVRPLVASVLRSADALLFLEGMRQHDNYTYSHAIGCAALAAAFGRHLGLPEYSILSLATGGLLMDVGKTRVPQQLLCTRRELRLEDVAALREHVAHGLAIAGSGSIDDPDVLDVLRTHHERHDGSGYPEGLAGDAIPMAGRMLAIIDSYDAMSSPRPWRAAISRHQALQEIYRARDRLYQTELVEQFLVCLGVYPTGSRVELSTGEIAVVLEQNHVRRLRPTVVVVSTPDKQPLAEFRVFDLLNQTSDGRTVEIVRALAGEAAPIAASPFAAST